MDRREGFSSRRCCDYQPLQRPAFKAPAHIDGALGPQGAEDPDVEEIELRMGAVWRLARRVKIGTRNPRSRSSKIFT